MSKYTIDVSASPYNAVLDGVTPCDAAVNAAVAAACAQGKSTVIIDGPAFLANPVKLPNGMQGRIRVTGGGEIIAGAPMVAPFWFDLSTGPNGGYANRAEVSDLTFSVMSGLTISKAMYVNYGTIPSEESRPGCVFDNLNFLDGFVDGLVLNNAWHTKTSRIYGYGNSATYDSGAGAGSGSVVAHTGMSVNNQIDTIQSDFWRATVNLTAALGQSFQGILISNIIAVQSPYAVCIDGTGGTGSGGTGAIQIRGITVDNGNVSTQSAGYAVWAKNVTSDIQVQGVYTTFNIKSFLSGMSFTGCSSVSVRGGRCYSSINTPFGIAFVGGGAHEVHGVNFFNFVNEVTFDAGTYNSRMSSCISEKGFCTPIDLGTNNRIGDAKGITGVIVFAGGQQTETIMLDISEASLGKKPDGPTPCVASDQFYKAQYDWDNPANTARSVAIKYWREDGGLTVKGNGSRVTFTTSP